MKKAEMEAHHAEYYSWMEKARDAEESGLYRNAIDAAIAAWDYIDGMIQCENKNNNKQIGNITSIDLVLMYAPLLLERKLLDKVETLLAERKRIQRATSEDQTIRLAESREQVYRNHRLWSYLERNVPAKENGLAANLGGDQRYWISVTNSWQKMGLLKRTLINGSHQVELTTRLGQVILAKCPACGKFSEAPKAMLLTKIACPNCDLNTQFIFCKPSNKWQE